MVKEGDSIPSVKLYDQSPENRVNIRELVVTSKAIIFGVPGAFTPSCSETHVPGFITNAQNLKTNQGIQEIICVAVNDPFVMSAWSKTLNNDGKVRMLADPNAELVKALDLTMEIEALGGIRSKRFSMVVENCIVKELNVEPDGVGLTCSLADHIGKKKQFENK